MKDIFEKFNSLNILIIGDVMMDTYIWGNVERISPEAPVPILSVIKKENRLGGAANVALNVQSLGAKPIICSVIGEDAKGDEFLKLIEKEKLSHEGILRVKNRLTTIKTRIIAHAQQIVRIDEETAENISAETTKLLLNKIKNIISTQNIHAIIFEDYDKGVITENLIENIVLLADKNQIITVADPKKRNFLYYKNVNLFKPNLKELKEGLKIDIKPDDQHQLEAAVDTLKKQLNIENVMITLSERGVYISSKKDKTLIPAHVRTIADVSGAGDTVIATAALCLAAGLNTFQTATIANLAGGLVCECVGVVAINKIQLQNNLDESLFTPYGFNGI